MRQRIVIQPQINQNIEKLVPVFQREQQKIDTKEQSLPVQYKSENIPKDVFVAGDQKIIQNIVEPKINRIKEVLNVTKTAEKKEVLDPIIKNLPNEQKVRLREYPLNATKYINQPIIEPIIENEKLNVKFVDSKDQI